MRQKIHKNSIHKRIRNYMAICYSSYFLAAFLIICITFLAFIKIFGTSICLDYSYDLASACSISWDGKLNQNLENKSKQEAKFLIDIVKAKFIVDDLLNNNAPVVPQNTGTDKAVVPKYAFGDLENEDFLKILLHGIISVRVEKNNVILKEYLDASTQTGEDNKITTRLLGGILDTEASTEILTKDGNHLGRVSVRINRVMVIGIYMAIVFFCFFTLLIVVLISKIVANLLSQQLITPVLALQEKMEVLAEGDVKSALSQEIHFDKPLKEIEDLVAVNWKITEKMKTYIEAIDKQKSEIKNLLDHTGEGYLFFGPDLMIRDSFSHECHLLFHGMKEGITFSSLLYGNLSNGSSEPAEFIQNSDEMRLDKLFKRILESRNLDLYEALLPATIKLGDKWIHLRYTLLEEEGSASSLMVISNDITGEKNLEEKLREERQKLRAIVSILTNRDEFLTLIKEYRTFIKETISRLPEMLTKESALLLREVHTFRGNLAQYEMSECASLLNTLELFLIEDQKGKGKEPFQISSEQFAETLETELAQFSMFVGRDFFSEQRIFQIPQSKLDRMVEILRSQLDSRCAEIALSQVAQLKYKPLKQLMQIYGEFSLQMANRQEKRLLPMKITGIDLEVDHTYYEELFTSFVHIFRNAIAHGIETPEDRAERDKPEAGQINCKIDMDSEGAFFTITIQDDGRGIQLDELLEHVDKHREVYGFTREEELPHSLDIIFRDGISSVKNRNQLAGNGVGLAAVQAQVQALNGSIKVYSEEGMGTSFVISLPFDKKHGLVTPLNPLVETLDGYIIHIVEQYFEGIEWKENRVEIDETLQTKLWLMLVPNEEEVASGSEDGHEQFGVELGIQMMKEKALALMELALGAKKADFEDSRAVCDGLQEVMNNICGNWSATVKSHRMTIYPEAQLPQELKNIRVEKVYLKL